MDLDAHRHLGRLGQIRLGARGLGDGHTHLPLDLGRDQGEGLVGPPHSNLEGPVGAQLELPGKGQRFARDRLHIRRRDPRRAQRDDAKDPPHRRDRLLHLLRLQVDALALLPHLALDAVGLQALAHVAPQLPEKVGAILALQADLAIPQQYQSHITNPIPEKPGFLLVETRFPTISPIQTRYNHPFSRYQFAVSSSAASRSFLGAKPNSRRAFSPEQIR